MNADAVLRGAEQVLRGYKEVNLYFLLEERQRFLPAEPVMVSSLGGVTIVPIHLVGAGMEYFSSIEECLEFFIGQETFSEEFAVGGSGILVWDSRRVLTLMHRRLTHAYANTLLLEGIMSVNCRREVQSGHGALHCESFFPERVVGIGGSNDIAGEWQLRGFDSGDVKMYLPEYIASFPEYVEGEHIGFSMLVTDDGQLQFLRERR